MKSQFLVASLIAIVLVSSAAPAAAQRRGGAVVGRAIPRTVVAPRVISPRVIGVVPYRPYFYRPGISFGFYAGYPWYYGYPYGYYGYGYPYFGAYPYYGYPYYGSQYGGYYHAYGGVRIKGAPRDAQVFADGYYVGVVDDFDGTFQHLNLEPGTHHIEIRPGGAQPIAFDVNVRPGETITYHAEIR